MTLHNKPLPRVDLSLDYDFFCRVLTEWDYGAREAPVFSELLWTIRYGQRDLFGECDQRRYADFLPERLAANLARRGIIFPWHEADQGTLAVEDSHRWAWDFFDSAWQESGPPDMLIQLDAHHDLYGLSPCVECDTWLAHLIGAWQEVPVTQLYPRWLPAWRLKAERECAWKTLAREFPRVGPRTVTLERWRWFAAARAHEMFPRGALVRNVYLCLSSPWVPPHLDAGFMRLAGSLGELFRRRQWGQEWGRDPRQTGDGAHFMESSLAIRKVLS